MSSRTVRWDSAMRSQRYHFGVIRAQNLLFNGEGSAVRIAGLLVFPTRGVYRCEAIQDYSDLIVIQPKVPLPYFKGAPEEVSDAIPMRDPYSSATGDKASALRGQLHPLYKQRSTRSNGASPK
jgi:hypothetical protein